MFYINDLEKPLGKSHTDVLNCAAIYASYNGRGGLLKPGPKLLNSDNKEKGYYL